MTARQYTTKASYGEPKQLSFWHGCTDLAGERSLESVLRSRFLRLVERGVQWPRSLKGIPHSPAFREYRALLEESTHRVPRYIDFSRFESKGFPDFLPNEDTQCTQRGYQYSGGESVRGEVWDLTQYHYHISASGIRVAQVILSRVSIPAHHSGIFKYAKPSPLKPCLSAASLRPYNEVISLETSGMSSSISRSCTRAAQKLGHYLSTHLLSNDKTCSYQACRQSWPMLRNESLSPIASVEVMANTRPTYLLHISTVCLIMIIPSFDALVLHHISLGPA